MLHTIEDFAIKIIESSGKCLESLEISLPYDVFNVFLYKQFGEEDVLSTNPVLIYVESDNKSTTLELKNVADIDEVSVICLFGTLTVKRLDEIR